MKLPTVRITINKDEYGALKPGLDPLRTGWRLLAWEAFRTVTPGTASTFRLQTYIGIGRTTRGSTKN
jgi:hypothetical protein